MEHSTDLFSVLGVTRDASLEDIKKSYSELVLIHHPDKGGDNKKFRELQSAYKILSNEKSRELYTNSLSSTCYELKNSFKSQVGIGYGSSEDDFTKGQSAEEKLAKRAEFMKRFDDNRPAEEREVYGSALEGVQDVSFEDYLQTRDNLEPIKTIPGFTPQNFNNNMFNQLFEHNKKTQTTELEPCDNHIDVTDLAPIDGSLITDQSQNNFDFMTHNHQMIDDIGIFDPNIDITTTQSTDSLKQVTQRLEEYKMQRDLLIQSDSTNPYVFHDDNPLSYQQMLSGL